MIDPANEQLLSLTDAARTIPRVGKRRVHCSTLWRWCRKGLRGVRLEYVKIGRRIATSSEALARFFNALAAADVDLPQGAPPLKQRPEHPKARAQAIQHAKEKLAKAGLL